MPVPLIRPAVRVSVIYHPTNGSVEIDALTADPDVVIVALTKALHAALTKTEGKVT
jgi:hypothetical protein